MPAIASNPARYCTTMTRSESARKQGLRIRRIQASAHNSGTLSTTHGFSTAAINKRHFSAVISSGSLANPAFTVREEAKIGAIRIDSRRFIEVKLNQIMSNNFDTVSSKQAINTGPMGFQASLALNSKSTCSSESLSNRAITIMADQTQQARPKASKGLGPANFKKKKKLLNRVPGQMTIEDLPIDAESNHNSVEAQQSDVEKSESESADQNEPSVIDSTSAPSEIKMPDSSVQESAEEGAITREKAVNVIERFFTVLVMAHISPQQALRSATDDEQPLTIEKFKQNIQQMGLEQFELVPTEVRALQALHNELGAGLDTKALRDQANTITFRVEMCEFQLRSAVCTDKTSSGKPARGKLDVQRVVRRLLANIPEESDGNAGTITSKQFELLMTTKLAITPGSFLTKIMFARIIRRPFQRNFPRMLEESRDTFCESLELFCTEKPLSMDCVEGQLRALVNRHPDLRQAFQDLDSDSSGSISRQEFITFLQREAQMQVPDETLSAFLKRFDMDGDGSLSYEEFAEFAHPKQFGIQVLSPFGMFYLGVNRLETMRNVVEKIKTRLFWLQHNELFSNSSLSSSESRKRADGVLPHSNSQTMTSNNRQSRLKLKVTKRFLLTHHFGSLRLQYKLSDRICSVLSNGEMVVLLMESDSHEATASNNDRRAQRDELSLPFKYRLKLTSKRRIAALFSNTQAIVQLEQLQYASSTVAKPTNLRVRRLRGQSSLSSAATTSNSQMACTGEHQEQVAAFSIGHGLANDSKWSESQSTPDKQSPEMQSVIKPSRPPSPLESDAFEDSNPDELEDGEQIAADADDAGDEMIAPRNEPEYPATGEDEELPPPYDKPQCVNFRNPRYDRLEYATIGRKEMFFF